MTRSQDHSQCSSHVVQGELLPKIDGIIDNVLGLSVFYQYVRTAALNQQQQTQHVSVFTAKLFAHYLHIRCLSVMECHQLTQTSSTDELRRYKKRFHELQEMFTTDMLVLSFVSRTEYATSDRRHVIHCVQHVPQISHSFNTSELVELLQKSAVEHLTTFRRCEAQKLRSAHRIITTDFKALYAYKCGKYRRCLQLSEHNVRKLIGRDIGEMAYIPVFRDFIQLMDDDIVSLTGLWLIVVSKSVCNPSYIQREASHVEVSQLPLCLHMMTQCQMKLRHPAASLAQTLDYVEVARRRHAGHFDQLLLKLIERKILLYISR